MHKLNADDFYQYQPDIDRRYWKASNPNTVRGADLKKERDYTICSECGGTGFVFKKIKLNRKRLVKCGCNGQKI